VIRTTGNGAPACKICGTAYKTAFKRPDGRTANLLEVSSLSIIVSFHSIVLYFFFNLILVLTLIVSLVIFPLFTSNLSLLNNTLLSLTLHTSILSPLPYSPSPNPPSLHNTALCTALHCTITPIDGDGRALFIPSSSDQT
jgi:hypothetical protein